jgi:hypothetical protein
MPYFNENPLDKLVFQPGAADAELDLRGLPAAHAMRAVEQVLHDPSPAGSYLIRFDPAGDDGHETLFLPLGRRLLQARRDGLLQRCLPASDGAAYFIAFSG